jgi:uncharacterized small protein (DUF1192 family)
MPDRKGVEFRETESMFEEPVEPRAFRGALSETTHEDLETYGVAELEERIEALQAEITRTAPSSQEAGGARRGQCAVWSPRLIRFTVITV